MTSVSHLDDLLRQQGAATPLSEQEASRTLALTAAELTKPVRPWRRDARNLVLAAVGMSVGLAAVNLATGNSSLALVLSRLATVLPLMALGGLAVWFAIAPGKLRARWGVIAATVLAMAALVVTRGDGHPSTLPQWVCTVSHVSLGFGPLVLALFTLRRSAPSLLRSVVAGLAVGTVGAVAGEVGCEQGWQHVLVFHLVPWLALTAASVVVSSRMKRWSYAP